MRINRFDLGEHHFQETDPIDTVNVPWVPFANFLAFRGGENYKTYIH